MDADRLKLDADHRYSLDGAPVVGVTGLLDWAGLAEDYSHVDAYTLARAKERGQFVHDYTARADRMELPDALGWVHRSVRPAEEPYVQAWLAFRAATGFTPTHIEQRVFHPVLRYAGTLDRLGTLPGWRFPAVVDIKTTAQLPKHVGPQTAAYAMAVRVSGLSAVGVRLCVHLKRDGTYQAHRLQDPNDWLTFERALVAWRRRN